MNGGALHRVRLLQQQRQRLPLHVVTGILQTLPPPQTAEVPTAVEGLLRSLPLRRVGWVHAGGVVGVVHQSPCPARVQEGVLVPLERGEGAARIPCLMESSARQRHRAGRLGREPSLVELQRRQSSGS